MYKATICITLRPSILDPQGKATRNALASLGYTSVEQVRVGKYVEMMIAADTADSAAEIARTSCEKLLANPVMEDFTVSVESVE